MIYLSDPGSELETLATESLEICGFQGFLFCFRPNFGLIVQNVQNVPLHAICGLLFHLLRGVTVHVEGKGGGSVSQVGLHRLYIVPALDSGNRVAVPLWHNKDKSENPVFSRGSGLSLVSVKTNDDLQ